MRAIVLTARELPAHVAIATSYTRNYTPAQITADTVPYGLSASQLRGAGVRGLYTQTLVRARDPNPYGYPWQYLGFATAAGAHRVYLSWKSKNIFHYPFSQAKGAARLCDEGEYYKVIGLSPAQFSLLCRVGPFLIFGHYDQQAALTALMTKVVTRARHARP